MNNGYNPGPNPGGSVDEAATGLKDSFKEEAKGARRAFDETAADISDKASALAGEAGQVIADKAEDAKQGLGANLKGFGDALRAAADKLAEGQPTASRIVTEAAAGLDRLSSSLENKSFSEVADEVRSIGRNNAGGLLAGSIIAGIALGRFLRSAESQGSSGPSTSPGGSSDTQSQSQRGDFASSGDRAMSDGGSATGSTGGTTGGSVNDFGAAR